MESGLIEFVCDAPGHEGDGRFHVVTVHEKCWAFCSSSESDGHHWIRVARLSLDEARLSTGRSTLITVETTEEIEAH